MSKFKKIAVIDIVGITDEAKEIIRGFSESEIVYPTSDSTTDQDVIARIGDADAVLGSWKSTLNKNILDYTANLKYVGICGTSLANIDQEELKNRGIHLTNVTDYGDEATAEYIFAQLLNLYRGFLGNHLDDEPRELHYKTIGIVGLGAVGKQVAKLALGFNMQVIYNSRTRNDEWESKGLKFVELHNLLRQSNVISLHVPKNLQILGSKEFELITPGKVLVDTCLGIVFDVQVFKAWIGKEQNFAIIDQKVEIENNVQGLKNVIYNQNITAGRTKESRERLSQKVLANISNYINIE